MPYICHVKDETVTLFQRLLPPLTQIWSSFLELTNLSFASSQSATIGGFTMVFHSHWKHHCLTKPQAGTWRNLKLEGWGSRGHPTNWFHISCCIRRRNCCLTALLEQKSSNNKIICLKFQRSIWPSNLIISKQNISTDASSTNPWSTKCSFVVSFKSLWFSIQSDNNMSHRRQSSQICASGRNLSKPFATYSNGWFKSNDTTERTTTCIVRGCSR